MKHYQSQHGVELTQCKLIKHFYSHLHTSNLRPERAKLTIRVQQTSNEFKSFHWNGTSVEIFLQLMENVFRIFTNSEFVNWFFFTPWIQYCWFYWKLRVEIFLMKMSDCQCLFDSILNEILNDFLYLPWKVKRNGQMNFAEASISTILLTNFNA